MKTIRLPEVKNFGSILSSDALEAKAKSDWLLNYEHKLKQKYWQQGGNEIMTFDEFVDDIRDNVKDAEIEKVSQKQTTLYPI